MERMAPATGVDAGASVGEYKVPTAGPAPSLGTIGVQGGPVGGGGTLLDLKLDLSGVPGAAAQGLMTGSIGVKAVSGVF